MPPPTETHGSNCQLQVAGAGSAFPAKSVSAVVNVATSGPGTVGALRGTRVTVLPSAESEGVADSAAPFEVNVTVPSATLAGKSGSENCALIASSTNTLLAAGAGTCFTSTGGVRSTTTERGRLSK